MKLDDKIQNRRVAYLLKSERPLAFELAILYYILAKRRTAKDKIADACLKSIQWLKKAEIEIPGDFLYTNPSEQLELLEKTLVQNKNLIRDINFEVGCLKFEVPIDGLLVHAIPMFHRDFVLRSSI